MPTPMYTVRDVPNAMGIEKTLQDRGKDYGEFCGHAAISQSIKDIMHSADNWERLTPSMKEALEMNAHKVARILNGNPQKIDSWHDIAGYATLVEQELRGNGTK